MSKTKQRNPCSECHSSNNLLTWEYQGREYTKCKTPGCRANSKPVQSTLSVGENAVTGQSPQSQELFTSGYFAEIPDRCLTKEVCEKYDYQICQFRGKDAHIANYYEANLDGKILCQKVRLCATKTFFWNGPSERAGLFGQHLKPKNFERIFVTEGEVDCLSLAQVMPDENVVSIRSGAGEQTLSEIKQHMTYLLQFNTVVFCFDSDTVGKDTARLCAMEFPPRRSAIFTPQFKDCNDYVTTKNSDELKRDIENYEYYVPESLIQPSLIEMMTPEPQGLDLPYPGLNNMIKGIKPGRLYTLMAGSGIGKSSFTKEIVFDLVNRYSIKVGLAYLEEAQKTSGQSFIALEHNIPLYKLEADPHTIPENDFKISYDKYIGKKLWFLNASFMKLTGHELLYNLEYLITGYGCSLIVLDHVTMVTYDMGGETSERKDLDILMKNLRQLVHRTQASIIVVSHLKRPGFGKSYDEGREVHMSDARSSGAIEQLSDVMIALERDMLSDNNSKTKVKVLKNRITGMTGYCDELSYVANKGRLRHDV